MVLTLSAWAAISISLKKGFSYDLRLRTWHCSSTLRVFLSSLKGTEGCIFSTVMRKFIVLIFVVVCAFSCLAQKDVTKFLGFPVDGTKSEMIRNLKSKGFKVSNIGNTEVLRGRFNGADVNVGIVTENGRVFRIGLIDENEIGETDIKIRFNNLCRQFKNNDKYVSFEDYIITDNEDISHEILVNKKRYEAIFYQKSDNEISDLEIINRPVWFLIKESFGKYYIVMYYDNEYNRANGEDL